MNDRKQGKLVRYKNVVTRDSISGEFHDSLRDSQDGELCEYAELEALLATYRNDDIELRKHLKSLACASRALCEWVGAQDTMPGQGTVDALDHLWDVLAAVGPWINGL